QHQLRRRPAQHALHRRRGAAGALLRHRLSLRLATAGPRARILGADMTNKKSDETAPSTLACPLRMAAAIGGLPAASEAMRDEVPRWLEMVTPTEAGSPTADVKYGASVDAAMATTTWRLSAGVERMRPGLEAYFVDFGADPGEAARLDASLEMLAPQRAGIWIELGNDALDTGWFLDEPF